MNLHRLAQQRAAAHRPVKVGLIGAGKFGSMFLAQVSRMSGVEVAVIADLDPERARAACQTVGWDPARITKTVFVASGTEACEDPEVESKPQGCRRRVSPMPARRSPPKSTSSWSMLKPMCSPAPSSPKGAGRGRGLFARLWRPTGARL
jgi:hypothetical protein